MSAAGFRWGEARRHDDGAPRPPGAAGRLRQAAAALLLLVCFLWLPTPAPATEPEVTADVSYRLMVRLDPDTRRLEGEAEILVRGPAPFELLLNAGFAPEPVRVDGEALRQRPERDGGAYKWFLPPGGAERRLQVRWRGTLPATTLGGEHRDTLGPPLPTADPRGSFLPAGTLWYPAVARAGHVLLHDYVVDLRLPAGQRGLVAGMRTGETVRDDGVHARFEFPHPSEGVDLMAGPYRVSETTARSADGRPIALRTYFHEELEALAPGYLEAVREYLALYEARIGPYPFASFSVVSSPTPTGFGMPTLTYLGIEVLKLPFIKTTSLGHEVLHNWWGNGVYPDYAAGNWSEGLTTFMADYAYALRAGPERAAAMRLGWLRELSGIPPGADRPLVAFTSRHHGVSQAVGYGKAAMLFVMLEDRLGEEAFTRALRRFWQEHRFRVAGWPDLAAAFEAESGEPLGPFFDQWLQRAGLPEIPELAARRTPDGLAVTLGQKSPPYVLDVPLRIESAAGTADRRVRLAQARQDFRLDAAAGELRLVLDPEHRMLRRLAPFEAPPLLREVQLDARARLLVLGDGALARSAQALAGRLFDHAPAAQAPGTAPEGGALLVIGARGKVEGWLARHRLPPPPPEVSGLGDVRMWTVRLPSGAPLAVVSADSGEALAAAQRPLPHYGQQSWLVLQQGKAQGRGVWPAQAPSVAVPAE